VPFFFFFLARIECLCEQQPPRRRAPLKASRAGEEERETQAGRTAAH